MFYHKFHNILIEKYIKLLRYDENFLRFQTWMKILGIDFFIQISYYKA